METNEMPVQAEGKQKKGLYGSTLKLIAIAIMLLDHIGATIVERQMMANGFGMATTQEQINLLLENKINILLAEGDNLLRLTGRLAFPLFAFLLTEGFQYTRNRKKYALRLALFALISEVPFDLATSGTVFHPTYQNVFFTLALGFIALCGMDALKKRTYESMGACILRELSFFLFGAMSLYYLRDSFIGEIADNFLHEYMEWTRRVNVFGVWLSVPNVKFFIAFTIAGVISMIVFHIITRKKEKQAVLSEAISWLPALLCMGGAVLLMTDYAEVGVLTIVLMYVFRESRTKAMVAGVIALTVYNFSEATAFINVPILKEYNGQKGKQIKYLFYAFYPVHLFVLYCICHFGFGTL